MAEPVKWDEVTRKVVRAKWDEMSWYEMVWARQVPEPEWYPAGLFGACISQSPKQTDPIYVLLVKKDKKKKLVALSPRSHG